MAGTDVCRRVKNLKRVLSSKNMLGEPPHSVQTRPCKKVGIIRNVHRRGRWEKGPMPHGPKLHPQNRSRLQATGGEEVHRVRSTTKRGGESYELFVTEYRLKMTASLANTAELASQQAIHPREFSVCCTALRYTAVGRIRYHTPWTASTKLNYSRAKRSCVMPTSK